MALQRKTAAVSGVNFGDLGMYSSGAFVPDGDYILFFNVLQHQSLDKDNRPKGPVRLGTMVDFFPVDTPAEEHKIQQFYSLGSKAMESFAPNPETGKGIVPIPNAKGTGLNDKTNWSFLLKSLYDSGLPQGVFTNDLTTIDGVHVHITNVPEPAERSTFASGTAEIQGEQRTPGKIAIVTEIKDDGKPWEGTGGLPEADAAPAPKVAVKVAPKATAKPAAKPAPAPVVEEADEGVRSAAIAAISDVIEKSPNGLPRLALRTGTFSVLKTDKAYGEEIASAVITSFFEPGTENDLAALLGELGYVVDGKNIKPAA